MKSRRQHILATLLTLLIIAGFAAPTLHSAAHLTMKDATDGHVEQHDHSVPHLEIDCVVCDLAASVRGTPPLTAESPTLAEQAALLAAAPISITSSAGLAPHSRGPPAYLL